MTGRERILAALAHEQPDRVPIDLAGTRDTTLVAEGYGRLKEHFNVDAPIKLCNRMMRVAEVDESILKALDIDTRAVFPGAPDQSAACDLGYNRYRDMWGVERVRPEGSYYYDQTEFPLSGMESASDINTHTWPDPTDPGYTRGLRERLDWIRGNTDAAAILTLPAPFVHITQYLRGFEDWFIDFAANTKFLDALFDRVLEITMEIARRELELVGQEVDIVFCADDLGSQDGLLVSPDHYRRHIKPRHKKYFDQIRSMTSAKIGFHSCGSVVDVIDDLIEIGVDVLNPIQVTAVGMDPLTLKKKYGDRLAFWGAMDTQHVLPNGTVGDVRCMVEERIEQMGKDGGYILSSCHNIQPDVPTDNVLAMFEHARTYRPAG